MTLQQHENELERLDEDADAIAAIVSSLDTSRLNMIASLVNDELIMRYQGKPSEKARLH